MSDFVTLRDLIEGVDPENWDLPLFLKLGDGGRLCECTGAAVGTWAHDEPAPHGLTKIYLLVGEGPPLPGEKEPIVPPKRILRVA